MPGGKYMAYAILAFFAFIFIVLLINSTTRFATIRACLGIVLVIMYQKYRKESEKATIAMEDEKDLERELEDK